MRQVGALAAQLEMIEPFIRPREHGRARQTVHTPLSRRCSGASIIEVSEINLPSVNHVVCHGIPSDENLKEGDIINVDVTLIKDGFLGPSKTFIVGKPR